MGQNSSRIREAEGYEIVEQLPIGNIVKSAKDQTLYFLKQCSFTAQQAYHNALNTYSLKLANKNEHILNFQHFTTKSQNSFCSTFHKIMLIYEYIDYSLADEIEIRIKDQRPFSEKEIWSVLCSCVLAAVHLINTEGKMHCGLTAKDIRLTSNGCVKLLSHEMIGIDTAHALFPVSRQQELPKALAMTLMECFTPHKSVQISRNSSCRTGVIEDLECSRQMKQILRLMTDSEIKFIELEEHLFKLVQEDQSMTSQSTTPVLKAQSPINSQYQCPKIYRQDYSECQYAQDKVSRSVIKSIPDKSRSAASRRQLSPTPSDCEDHQSIKLTIQCEIPEQQNPDQGEQDQNGPEDRNCKQVQHFVLTENTRCIQQNRMGVQNAEKIYSKYDIPSQFQYQSGYHHFSESGTAKDRQSLGKAPNKENELNRDIQAFNETSFKIMDEANNYGPATHKQKDDSLFTDPKLYSMIKSDLKEIEMRKSMTVSHQPNNYQPQKNTMKCDSEQDRNWGLSQPNYSAPDAEDRRENVERRSMPNDAAIEMIKQCSQEYREEESQSLENTFKSKKSTASNIMCDDQLGLKRKKTDRNQGTRGYSDREHRWNREATLLSQTANQEMVGCKNGCQEVYGKESREMTGKYAGLSSQHSFEGEDAQSSNLSEPHEKLTKVSEQYHKGKYQGTKLNGKRHGYGAFYYSEGGKYVGKWKENKMHGRGTLYYPNQAIAYEGEWKNDQLCGFGVLFNQEVTPLRNPFDYRDWSDVEDFWVKYEGHFQGDNKQGKGRLYLANGQRLQAEFHNDMVDGDGTLFKDDGSSIRGRWKKNVLVKLF